jgi:predicted MPP superfamily phosphohydrolase
MRSFLLTFFLFYGAMHYYIFSKAEGVLIVGFWSRLIGILFMTLMVFAPLIVHFTRKKGLETGAQRMAYVGYSWMGFAFLFFSGSVLIDLSGFLLQGAGSILNQNFFSFSPTMRFTLPLGMAIGAGIYAYLEALQIRIERVVLKTAKIPGGSNPFRIVQISDIHLGLIVREKRLARILQKVKDARPDLLVCTGDLLDGQINHLDAIAELFQEIRPPFGKFAVTGNHEFYAGLEKSLQFIRKAGFHVLRGETTCIGGFLNLAGVDDLTGRYYGIKRDGDEKELLSGLSKEAFTVLLKHRPQADPDSLGLYDLQISGHTHRGQILPFRLITRLFFSFPGGFYRLPKGSLLYTSRGSGTWGPPMRFLTPPEVTVFELVRDEKE